MPRRRQWARVTALAWQDFVHDWRVSLCLTLALAAVLAPLLVLFGLKSGTVATMRERLRADPRSREILIVGHHRLSPQWFDAVRAREDVSFVVPKTRQLSATVTVETATGEQLVDVDMIPTQTGDPLVPPGVPIPGAREEVLLTRSAAQRLDIKAGESLEGVIGRRLDDQFEGLTLSLRVIGILPESSFGRQALFVSENLLTAAEDFRDGYTLPELGVERGKPRPTGVRYFASARVYARDLEDVAEVARIVRAWDIDVITRATDIEAVQSIDRVLSLVFVVLAGIGVTGYLASMAVSLWANVERKRRDIALLRLLGLRSIPSMGFPVAQAILVALGGGTLSAATYWFVARLFDRAFSSELRHQEFVCRLAPEDALLAATLTLILALLSSLTGGYRALQIDPADSLREL